MGKGLQVAGLGSTRRALVGASFSVLVALGCGTEPPGEPPVTGPPMGIIELDPDDIPLGEGAKPGQGQGGSGALGGSGPLGGNGGLGGSGGSNGGGSAGSQPLPEPNDLGKACEATTDCGGGLSCHMDPVDYMVHLQCTTSCMSDADCDAIDPGGFCIGANLCVHACVTDLDCGPKTRCNDFGWCERKGPGSGVPYCGGFATPCLLLSGSQCIGTLGCNDDSDCSGSSQSCYSQFDVYSCSSQDGCYWSSLSKNCSGVARSCSGYASSVSCESQDGCYWTESCTGTPRDCEELPVDLCAQQPGCTVLQ